MVNPKNKEIVDSNPRATQILGYTREEMNNMPVEVVHPHDMEKLMSCAKRVFKLGTSWTDKLQCRCKDGTMRESEVSGSVFEIDSRKVLIAQVRDTSLIKKLEKERDQGNA